MSVKANRTLLLVEDDSEAREKWKRDVLEQNESVTDDKNVCFDLVCANNAKDALQILSQRNIDCAIVDLRIPKGGDSDNDVPNAQAGNEVLESALKEAGIPLVLYSGYSEEVSETVQKSCVKIFAKQGGASKDILDLLTSQDGLMEAMSQLRAKVAKATATVFSQSIWPRWESRWHKAPFEMGMADVITRQVVSYVAEQLGYAQLYHPEEFYFNPPLSSDRLGTGDLVRIGSDVYVLVNPRCNMDRCAYPSSFTLAYCKPLGEQWDDLIQRTKLGNKREKALEQARRFASQDHSLSKHFIPSCDNEGPWLIDFGEIKSVSSKDAKDLVQSRLATISPQFLPNLVQRYSAYLGRIGQPDLDCELLVDGELSDSQTE